MDYSYTIRGYADLTYENGTTDGPLYSTTYGRQAVENVIHSCLLDPKCMIVNTFADDTSAMAYAPPSKHSHIVFNSNGDRAAVYIRQGLRGYHKPPTANIAPPGYMRLPLYNGKQVTLDVDGMGLVPLYTAGPIAGSRYASTNEGYDACLADPNCEWMVNDSTTMVSSYYPHIATPKYKYSDGNTVSNYKPAIVDPPVINII
jgi:hypothetical protein